MSATTHLPSVSKAKRAGIQCEFKPAASKRVTRHATADQAKAAAEWAVEKYAEAFKTLAK